MSIKGYFIYVWCRKFKGKTINLHFIIIVTSTIEVHMIFLIQIDGGHFRSTNPRRSTSNFITKPHLLSSFFKFRRQETVHGESFYIKIHFISCPNSLHYHCGMGYRVLTKLEHRNWCHTCVSDIDTIDDSVVFYERHHCHFQKMLLSFPEALILRRWESS